MKLSLEVPRPGKAEPFRTVRRPSRDATWPVAGASSLPDHETFNLDLSIQSLTSMTNEQCEMIYGKCFLLTHPLPQEVLTSFPSDDPFSPRLFR